MCVESWGYEYVGERTVGCLFIASAVWHVKADKIYVSLVCVCDFCSYFLSAVGFFEEFERIWTQIRRTSVILVDRWWLYKKNMMACWVKKGEKWVSFDFSKIYSSKCLAMWLLSLVLSLKSFKNVISNKNCIPHYFFINILSNPIQR